jgi:hypothetical protein
MRCKARLAVDWPAGLAEVMGLFGQNQFAEAGKPKLVELVTVFDEQAVAAPQQLAGADPQGRRRRIDRSRSIGSWLGRKDSGRRERRGRHRVWLGRIRSRMRSILIETLAYVKPGGRGLVAPRPGPCLRRWSGP